MIQRGPLLLTSALSVIGRSRVTFLVAFWLTSWLKVATPPLSGIAVFQLEAVPQLPSAFTTQLPLVCPKLRRGDEATATAARKAARADLDRMRYLLSLSRTKCVRTGNRGRKHTKRTSPR